MTLAKGCLLLYRALSKNHKSKFIRMSNHYISHPNKIRIFLEKNSILKILCFSYQSIIVPNFHATKIEILWCSQKLRGLIRVRGSHGSEDIHWSILGCDAVCSCRWLATFRRNVSPLYAGWILHHEDGYDTYLRNVG